MLISRNQLLITKSSYKTDTLGQMCIISSYHMIQYVFCSSMQIKGDGNPGDYYVLYERS